MPTRPAAHRIAEELRLAMGAKKCHPCGCFHDAIKRLDEAQSAFSPAARKELLATLEEAREHLVPLEHGCLACATCWPANALAIARESRPGANLVSRCLTVEPKRDHRWPPFLGEYRLLDSGAHIALCTLTTEPLMNAVAQARPDGVAIVGILQTENLGIERLIQNVLSNPNITELVICGADSRRRIGHFPGQSLVSLWSNGIDKNGSIKGATGRRPEIKNVSSEIVKTFRQEIALHDHRGEVEPDAVLDAIAKLADPVALDHRRPVHADRPRTIKARSPIRLTLDPKGYFILFPNRRTGVIVVEHYENDGTLSHVLEGRSADELFTTVIGLGLISRLDHAAYLGKELARAECAIQRDTPYVQDKAPEPVTGQS